MPDLYLGKIPIVTRDLNEGFIRGDAPRPDELATGCVPRDLSVDPVLMRDSPSGMKVYPRSEWDARYDAAQETESSLLHIYLRAAEAGKFDFLDQGQFPDCWAHSTAHAVMIDRLRQNLPFVRINAVAIATMLNQLNGGWCGLSMKFIRENGAPEVGTGPGQWPYQSRRGTPDRTAMARYKGLEDWYDLGREVYEQTLSQDQLTTALFDNCPAPSDYNPFGHSMLSLARVRIERNSWGTATLNSWKGFGYLGLCIIREMWPNNATALRASTPSS